MTMMSYSTGLLSQLILKLMTVKVHAILLEKIVELYVTVRGFSLAGGWLEQYKQHTKQSTQRTRSLRRELHDGYTA